MRFNWDGLPTVLEAGREYDIHLGAYDVSTGSRFGQRRI